MADYFTEQAQEALEYAHRAAEELHNSYIGTEHLLLARAAAWQDRFSLKTRRRKSVFSR